MANPAPAIGGIIVGVPLIFWSLLIGGAAVGGLYFYLRQQVRAVITEVETSKLSV